MNPDPLVELESFYDECRGATVPQRLLICPVALPWWQRVAIPLAAISFGGLVALLILALPSNPSIEFRDQAARALLESQMRQAPQLPAPHHSRAGRSLSWNA